MKPIWIVVIIILALVVLYLAFGPKAKAAEITDTGVPTPSTGGETGAGGLVNLLGDMATGAGAPTRRECKQVCQGLCKGQRQGLFCGPRCRCKRACRVDCTQGKDVTQIHPQAAY